jgi:hypothetical protein
MKNVSYSELLNTLTMKQEVQLRNIADTYRKEKHETSPQLMINKIEEARTKLINQHDTPAEQKQWKDSAWQYLLYHMSL